MAEGAELAGVALVPAAIPMGTPLILMCLH